MDFYTWLAYGSGWFGRWRLIVKILGSGTSSGVPMIGCQCPVCTSSDPRNKRTRASAAIELERGTILIDTATDLRAQALRWGLERVDAVLYTHAHADHLHGIDDLRLYNLRQLKPIPCFTNADTACRLRAYFDYIFDPAGAESFRPTLELEVVEAPFSLLGETVIPVPLLHGEMPVLGFRLRRFAYLTDVSAIPDRSWRLLEGLDLLVLDALRPRPHPTHFGLDQALEVVDRLRPRRTLLTHLSHQFDHETTNEKLPIGVELAYDGMIVELEDEACGGETERSLQ